jgi:hypothetical protein
MSFSFRARVDAAGNLFLGFSNRYPHNSYQECMNTTVCNIYGAVATFTGVGVMGTVIEQMGGDSTGDITYGCNASLPNS